MLRDLPIYARILWAHQRSQATYGVSFALELVGSALLLGAELGEIAVYFHNVKTLGGMNLPAMMLLVAMGGVAFTLSVVLGRNVTHLTDLVKNGTLETLYTRPLPILGQAFTLDFNIARAGRGVLGIAVFCWAWNWAQVPVNWWTLTVAGASLVATTMTFFALHLVVGALQLLITGADEAAAATLHSTAYVAQVPTSIFPNSIQWLYFTLLPVGLTIYLPVASLTNSAVPQWVPSWGLAAGFCSWIIPGVLSLGLWRLGVRRYEGAGG